MAQDQRVVRHKAQHLPAQASEKIGTAELCDDLTAKIRSGQQHIRDIGDRRRRGIDSADHEAGDIDKAVVEYKKTISLQPDDFEAYNNLGVAYMKMERYDEAIKTFFEVIKFNSCFL